MPLMHERIHLEKTWWHQRYPWMMKSPAEGQYGLLLESDPGTGVDFLLLESDSGAGTDILLLEDSP